MLGILMPPAGDMKLTPKPWDLEANAAAEAD